MRYTDSELQHRLAGEYVLGTLHGRARRRFERLIAERPELRARVDDWQRRLNPLAEALAPVEPPARVWRALQRRLPLGQAKPRLWERVQFWRPAGLTAAAAAFLLGLYLVLVPPTVVGTRYVAVVSDEAAQATWLISSRQGEGSIKVQVLRPQVLPADRSFELWLLRDAAAPRSLGLIPGRGTTVLRLPEIAGGPLDAGLGLAVSLEPAGGSPTGQPTGPVLYQGKVIPL